jgi:hypothetical protein
MGAVACAVLRHPIKYCRFENPKAAKALPAIVNIGDAFSDSFAKDFTLEVDRIKVGVAPDQAPHDPARIRA